ncbi:mechanosensitive ion channel family protein [Pseudomonadota bacterium]
MEFTFDINQLNGLAQDFLTWLQTHVLVVPSLAQIGVIVFTYILAQLFDKPLQSALDKAISGEWAARHRYQAKQILSPLVMPLAWLVLVGTAQLAALRLGWPVGVLGVAVSLLTAWVVIRLVLNFIADPWWSKAVAIFVWALAALDIIGLLDPTLAFMDKLALNLGDFRISMLGVGKAIVALVVFLWIANWAARTVEGRLRALSHLTPSQQVLFGKLARVLFITVAILVALNSVGIDLTALAVFSGALGLGIGFGLQKVVANLLSGVILLLDRSVKPGDVIAINNTYGWINTIGARYVSVVTRDGVEHLIPNEELISRPVENWSHSDRNVRQRLPIGVSYESDVHKAIKLAIEAASSSDRILNDPAPRCLLKGYGDNSVDLELRVWIQDAEEGVSNIKSEIYLKIWDLYHENDIAFPYPQRDIHVRGPVKVEVQS